MGNVLSREDADLFCRIFYPLLAYVNDRFRITEKLGDVVTADAGEQFKVAQKLWSDVSLIDDYLNLHPELPEEERQIAESWKMALPGRYVAEAHLKSGTVFMSLEEPAEDFVVCGIFAALKQVFGNQQLPITVHATLIPFRNVIITDGFLLRSNAPTNILIRRGLKMGYLDAKAKGRFYTDLNQKFHPELVKKAAPRGSSPREQTCWKIRVYPKGMSQITTRTYWVSENTRMKTFTANILDTWQLDPSVTCICHSGKNSYDTGCHLADLHPEKGKNLTLSYGGKYTFVLHVMDSRQDVCKWCLSLVDFLGERDVLENPDRNSGT